MPGITRLSEVFSEFEHIQTLDEPVVDGDLRGVDLEEVGMTFFFLAKEIKEGADPVVQEIHVRAPYDGVSPNGLYIGMPSKEALAIQERDYEMLLPPTDPDGTADYGLLYALPGNASLQSRGAFESHRNQGGVDRMEFRPSTAYPLITIPEAWTQVMQAQGYDARCRGYMSGGQLEFFIDIWDKDLPDTQLLYICDRGMGFLLGLQPVAPDAGNWPSARLNITDAGRTKCWITFEDIEQLSLITDQEQGARALFEKFHGLAETLRQPRFGE
jgi:hypothetical protein